MARLYDINKVNEVIAEADKLYEDKNINGAIDRYEQILKHISTAYKESSEMQRKIIINSSFKESMKNSLLGISSFKEFLSEVLNVATAGKDSLQDSSRLSDHKDSVVKLDKSSNIKEIEAMKVLSGDKEANYTGEVEFNLILSNDRGEKSNIRYSGIGSFNMGIMNSTIKKKVGYASVLGIIVVIAFAGLFSINAGSKSQAMDKKSIVSNENKIEQKKTEPKVLESEKMETNTEKIILSDIETEVNEETDKLPLETEKNFEEPAKTNLEVDCEIANEEKKGSNESKVSSEIVSEADKKDTANLTEKNNTIADTNANSTTNNTDKSIVIDNSPFVGNENIIGVGNNIYINIEN